MEINIINSPYYMDNGCSCCDGWWYDSYTIEVDGGEIVLPFYTGDEGELMSFSCLEDAEGYVKKHFPNQPYQVVDDGYPDEDFE